MRSPGHTAGSQRTNFVSPHTVSRGVHSVRAQRRSGTRNARPAEEARSARWERRWAKGSRPSYVVSPDAEQPDASERLPSRRRSGVRIPRGTPRASCHGAYLLDLLRFPGIGCVVKVVNEIVRDKRRRSAANFRGHHSNLVRCTVKPDQRIGKGSRRLDVSPRVSVGRGSLVRYVHIAVRVHLVSRLLRDRALRTGRGNSGPW
jgi:hypothetical protein